MKLFGRKKRQFVKLLIVEDEPLVAFDTEHVLTDADYEVVATVADAARSGNESGDGIVWTTPVGDVTHNRTGMRLEEVERV